MNKEEAFKALTCVYNAAKDFVRAADLGVARPELERVDEYVQEKLVKLAEAVGKLRVLGKVERS